MADLAFEIRHRLARYLGGKESFEAFESWFVGATWNMHAIEDDDARALAGAITLRFAEFTNGHWTEPQFRLQLAGLVRGTGALGRARVSITSPPHRQFAHPVRAESTHFTIEADRL